MVIYEFIYHSGPEDWTSDFYANNNQSSRNHFFNSILVDAEKALVDYQESCKANEEEINDCLLELYKDATSALTKMKAEFIETGKAKFDMYTSIVIAERTVKDI
ncbi:hypothetical protein Asch01_01882 [Acinetobacter schindleri]|uniref:hypothetical protein n=1 Tax=Acinetobacter schindleri TaxID=108981 RepID=UPI0030969E80